MFWQEGFRVSEMNTPFSDELKKGVKRLWALVLPFMNSSTTSIVDAIYGFLHNIYEEGNLNKFLHFFLTGSSPWWKLFPWIATAILYLYIILLPYLSMIVLTYYTRREIINTLGIYILYYSKLIKTSSSILERDGIKRDGLGVVKA